MKYIIDVTLADGTDFCFEYNTLDEAKEMYNAFYISINNRCKVTMKQRISTRICRNIKIEL